MSAPKEIAARRAKELGEALEELSQRLAEADDVESVVLAMMLGNATEQLSEDAFGLAVETVSSIMEDLDAEDSNGGSDMVPHESRSEADYDDEGRATERGLVGMLLK